MGNSEEGKSSKSDDKSTPPTPEQSNVYPVYPNWTSMQAYYGPRVTLPKYFNFVVASGHPPPPYMWGPPPQGLQPTGQGAPSSAAKGEALACTALSIDTPVKSSQRSTDEGLVKKLKNFEGLAMSLGNGNSEKHEGASENRSSKSEESAGSTNGRDGNMEGAEESKRKRIDYETPVAAVNERPETKPTLLVGGKITLSGDKVLGVLVSTANEAGKMVGPVIASPSVATTLELRNLGANEKATPVAVATPNAIMSSETWLQNEREMKRERRKQSNRESARRSRLRKQVLVHLFILKIPLFQAEAEKLARRVESLNAENIALKAEINQLLGNSEKLRQENKKLKGKLENTKPGQSEETGSSGAAVSESPPIDTENLLLRMNDNSVGRSLEGGEGDDVYDKGSNSGPKLHQLLDTCPRAEAVAAG